MKVFLQENVPLAPFTTFRIGGPARYFAEAANEEAVAEALGFAASRNLPVFILGGGSNLLVADRGFSGLVIRVAISGIEFHESGPAVLVSAGAGETWDRVVVLSVDRGLAGIECLSGIPGSVGGTPVQNVGAYGQEVSDVLQTVRVYDRSNRSVAELSVEDCRFGYRSSIFNTTAKERYVVLAVRYVLTRNGAPCLRYTEVQREFESPPEQPSLAAVREAVLRIRKRKAMLLVEGDADCRSAGSFFKNPVLPESQFASLVAVAGPGLPRYPAAPGKVKTAAAWLIEQAGFRKGYSLGAAALSTKHTLALVNRGGATSDDILKLAREIRRRVHERFGVRLVPEPVLLGFEDEVQAEFAP